MRTPRWTTRGDLRLAAVLVAVSQLEVWGYGAAGGGSAAALTLGLAGAAMLIRGRWPIACAAAVATGLSLCAVFAGEPFSATSVLTFTIAFFSVGAMPNRRWSLVALVVTLGLAAFTVQPFDINTYLAAALSSVGVPWLLGLLWLRRRTGREEARRHGEAAERAIAAERLRLAQELHDVVSHNVGMIAVQAGAADVLLESDPQRSRESLRAIEDGARATLLELRRLLGLLRDADPDPLTPQTSLAELDRLTQPLEHAGVDVVVRAEGTPTRLGREVETAAYRLVQEALTNVVVHAGRCQVAITVRYLADALDVEVADDGQALGGTSRGGYGLVGVRERVAALGGTVHAGPRPEGGFRVRAVMPLLST